MGPLWKLNSKVHRSDNLAHLHNWRYRQFYLLKKGQIAAVSYVSEKDGGNIILACSFNRRASNDKGFLYSDSDGSGPTSGSGPVEVLPALEVEPLDFEKAESMSTSVQQYRIAFCGGGGHLLPYQSPTEYLPSNLYPFSITWRDADNNQQKLIVSATTLALRDDWVEKIKNALKGDS